MVFEPTRPIAVGRDDLARQGVPQNHGTLQPVDVAGVRQPVELAPPEKVRLNARPMFLLPVPKHEVDVTEDRLRCAIRCTACAERGHVWGWIRHLPVVRGWRLPVVCHVAGTTGSAKGDS